MTIKLAELEAALAAMTPGEWKTAVWCCSDPGGGWAAIGLHHKGDDDCGEPGGADDLRAQSDAAGIVVMHNAMPVLLEIATSVIEFELARKQAARSRFQFAQDETEANWETLQQDDRRYWACSERREAALAQVSP